MSGFEGGNVAASGAGGSAETTRRSSGRADCRLPISGHPDLALLLKRFAEAEKAMLANIAE
jgi:hypothetical protein